MAILDSLIGRGQIREQRQLADEAARARFDPSQFNPQLQEAQLQAQEGIVDDPVRKRGIERIFATTDIDQTDVGTGQGRFLSMMQETEEGRADALGELETDISLAEEQAQREGRTRAADIMGKRRQIEAQREAKMKQNRMMAEAEAQKRRGQLMGSLVGFGLSAVGGAPAIGSKIGGALGIGTPGLDRPSAPINKPANNIIEEDIDADLGLEEEIDEFVGF